MRRFLFSLICVPAVVCTLVSYFCFANHALSNVVGYVLFVIGILLFLGASIVKLKKYFWSIWLFLVLHASVGAAGAHLMAREQTIAIGIILFALMIIFIAASIPVMLLCSPE